MGNCFKPGQMILKQLGVRWVGTFACPMHTLTHVYILHAMYYMYTVYYNVCFKMTAKSAKLLLLGKFREQHNSANVTTVTVYHHVQ